MTIPIVYHYCSLETALAILNTKTLRLSDITRSNDSAEIAYGYRAALAAFERCGLIDTQGTRLHFNADWTALAPHYRSMLSEALGERTVPPNRICYAVCFSEQSDLLSQWRAYGDDGQGLSLGFDLSSLASTPPLFDIPSANHADDQELPFEHRGMLMCRPMEYGIDCSAKIFDQLSATIAASLQQIRSGSSDEISHARTVLRDTSLMFIAQTAFCKKHFFHEEREWRVALWGPRTMAANTGTIFTDRITAHCSPFITSARFHVLARADQLVPAIDLGLDFSRMLRSVTLGPRCRARIEDVRLLLDSLGLDAVSIHRSDGTYQR